MKKFFTLAFLAFFFCLTSMAEVVLGDIKFSLGEGKKISPTTGKITVTFPNVTGVDDPTATTFVMEGSFGVEGTEWDGIEGTFASGVTFDLADYELQPSTDYTLKITSVKVDGAELAPEGGYALNFKTRGAERKMAWTFAIDDASLALIQEEATANTESDETKYIDLSGDKGPRFYVPARNNEEIMLPDGTALPMTEDLQFKFGSKVFYVGGQTGNFANQICFNGQNQYMTIPDCQEGDVITFNANRSTKGNSSKQTCIQAMNSAAIAPDGIEASTGVKDSIWLNSSFTNFKFEVQTAGDITFRFSNCLLKSVTVEESQEKLPRNYNVVAQYKAEGSDAIELMELVPLTPGTTGSTIKANYPYWLTDAEGKVYTHGSKGNEFVAIFDLKNGEGDTTFVVNYTKTVYEGAVYLSEGEDIPGALLVNHANTAIRSSMGKAAYVAEDTKLVTLQPGTYKIRAVLFDVKPVSYVCTLTKGAGEENEIYLSSTADNWTEAESDLLTITEATDITLKASTADNQGVDVILIYASTDAPDDPDDPSGIVDINNAGQKAAVRKVMKGGKLLIETEAGTVNVAGIEVK